MKELHLQPPEDKPFPPPGKRLTWEWDDFNLVGKPMKGYDNPKEPRLGAFFVFDADDDDWHFEDNEGCFYFDDACREQQTISIDEWHPLLLPYLKHLDTCIREHVMDSDPEDWQ